MRDRVHGSPYDRGSADYYYWRPRRPHWYPNGTGTIPEITMEHMTDAEIAEYMLGYAEEFDRKDWR